MRGSFIDGAFCVWGEFERHVYGRWRVRSSLRCESTRAGPRGQPCFESKTAAPLSDFCTSRLPTDSPQELIVSLCQWNVCCLLFALSVRTACEMYSAGERSRDSDAHSITGEVAMQVRMCARYMVLRGVDSC